MCAATILCRVDQVNDMLSGATIAADGEPPVQTMGLRSLISTVSLPRVKRLLRQSCSELSRACSKRGTARMPKSPRGEKRPANA